MANDQREAAMAMASHVNGQHRSTYGQQAWTVAMAMASSWTGPGPKKTNQKEELKNSKAWPSFGQPVSVHVLALALAMALPAVMAMTMVMAMATMAMVMAMDMAMAGAVFVAMTRVMAWAGA